MLYELNYLVLQSKTEDLASIRKFVKEWVVGLGGEIKEEKEFLKRKLAYQIKKESYGFYTVLRFETEEDDFINRLKKKLDLSSKIDRYIIVRAENLPLLEDFFAKESETLDKQTVKQEDVGKLLINKKSEETGRKINTEAETETSVINDQEKKEEVANKDKGPDETKKPRNEGDSLIDSENDQGDNEEKGRRDKNKKDKISLDDLDKKLDEILNI
ncbi:MAG: 30S ribosomal protein S6 [Candidatus Moranbacteria bacterium]|jgi:small subunit ribosomal protein S6|nr:30S ribosomal protein S6 [Candidatus Moranbacteria bacterium]